MEFLGWDQVEAGAVIPSFEDNSCDIVKLKQEERNYAKTNSYTASVADWRVFKPVFNKDVCIDCQNCWVFCPDTAIVARDKDMLGIDYDHCKGCGICAEVCPTNPKSLIMFFENDDNDTVLSQWPQKKKKEK